MCHRFLSKATQHDKHKCTNTMWWYPKRIPIPVLYGQLDLLISNGDIIIASLPFSTSLLSLFWWLWDLWIRSSYRIIPHSDIIRLVAFTIEKTSKWVMKENLKLEADDSCRASSKPSSKARLAPCPNAGVTAWAASAHIVNFNRDFKILAIPTSTDQVLLQLAAFRYVEYLETSILMPD
jgi:hypothetical protein